MSPGTPTGAGLFGGYHGGTTQFHGVADSDIVQHYATGELPATAAEIRGLAGEQRDLRAKEMNRQLLDGDVIEAVLFGGGGYGDPLDRDPEAVLADIRSGEVAARFADPVYGVVLTGRDGAPPGVDFDATAQLRRRRRAERLERAAVRPEREARRVAPRILMGEALGVALIDGEPTWCCARCEAVLGSVEANYKTLAARVDGQLTDVDDVVFSDPQLDTDEHVVYSQYACPSCGGLFDNELRVEGDEPVWDIRPDVESLRTALSA
jgi:N-methylhydantoinase B